MLGVLLVRCRGVVALLGSGVVEERHGALALQERVGGVWRRAVACPSKSLVAQASGSGALVRVFCLCNEVSLS